MTETKVYADDFRCSFGDSDQFIEFLKERKAQSTWMTAPSKSLQFRALEGNENLSNLYMQIYQSNGKAEVLADTMENTSLLLNIKGTDYPSALLRSEDDPGAGPYFRQRTEQSIS